MLNMFELSVLPVLKKLMHLHSFKLLLVAGSFFLMFYCCCGMFDKKKAVLIHIKKKITWTCILTCSVKSYI